MKTTIRWLAGGSLLFHAFSTMVHAGVYASINVDGNPSDWDSVPVAITDLAGDASPLDITLVQFANDDDWFYILVNFNTAVNPNSGAPSLYLALDNDSNAATGFDIFNAGQIGAEVGWQNDFAFDQATGVFDTGNGITGGTAGIAPFFTATALQEIRISRAATFASGPNAGQPIFTNDSFRFGFYSQGNSDFDELVVGTYEFAIVPEPGTAVLLLGGICGLLVWRGGSRRTRLAA